MIKKQISHLLTGLALGISTLSAGPLLESEIAKDAKWVAHIDIENLSKSTLGSLGIAKLKEAYEEKNDSKVKIDFDLVLGELKSITAYGEKFDDKELDGVLILKTGDRLQAIFDGFLAHQEMESGGELALQRVEGKPYETFVLDDELYLSFPSKSVAIASKSFEQIENAYAVIEGKSKSLRDEKDKLVLNSDAGFFLMVSATGIDGLKNVPPQARMLQKTKGGQLSIGENEKIFRANLILTTSDNKTALQLYRIVQGMLSLASLTQVENHSVMDLVDAVSLQQGENFVSLDFQYPIDNFKQFIEGLIGEPIDTDASARTSGDGGSRFDTLAGERSNTLVAMR